MDPSPRPDPRRALRTRYRRARRALADDVRRANERAIARAAITSPAVIRARRIGAYAAADGEPRIEPLLERLDRLHKLLALPVVRARGAMAFHRHRPGERTVHNRYGIVEPPLGAAFVDSRSLDLVFVPLVAFDARGHRLGMGAGYYDRHFGRLARPLRPMLVGVAFEVSRAVDLPARPWDVKLDAMLTERGWHQSL